jgi:UDP-3-O-[3-hydroxymyristoyl] glucosamine N-acyltransferase
MKLHKPLSLHYINSIINQKIIGESTMLVSGCNEIHKVQKGDITFVDHPKYYDKALQSAASFIIINKEVNVPDGKAIIISDDPFRDFVKITKYFMPFVPASLALSKSAKIGINTHIQPNVFIGNQVKIGNNCIIHANVSIYDGVIIGDNVIVHSGSVLGSDAFYFKKRIDRELMHDKLYSCGNVIVENDVEIGACCTIDKGVSGDTIIGAGTKLDNHVHVGHGVVIGKNCLIAAQVGIAGKTILEDNVTLWGQVGVNKDLTIGSGAIVYAQSGVPASLEGNKTYFGSPVGEAKDKMKELVWLKRLPDLFKKN